MLSRREFVQAGSLAAALAARASARQLQTIGFQMYTVRGVLGNKAAETLKAVREIGYREIEPFGAIDAVWPAIQASGLKPVSLHLDSAVVTKGTADDLSRAMDTAKQRGFNYAVMPYLPPTERGGLDVVKALAGKLNSAGEKARAAGLTFCYHNHAFEFEPTGGTMPFDVLADNTDKKLVGFEADLFWVSVAGHDPVEFLKKVSGRVPLVHLKDKAEGAKVQYNESVPRTTFKEVGHGVIDWPKALDAAASAGVQHYFVEQDQTPGDPVESLRQSYAYLSRLMY
jgi:sugar phosphate isomerase/epimerase